MGFKIKNFKKMNKTENNLLIGDYYEKFNHLARSFLSDQYNIKNMNEAINLLRNTKSNNAGIYLIGNGGSASVAEHIAIDLTKNAGLKALTVSGSPMLTTFSNDFGYNNVFKKFIEKFGTKKDVLIAISSSGQSENIINACKEAKRKGLEVVTLSGFDADNPLRKLGGINFWVNSKAYGYLEIFHSLILHWINDSIIGSEVYKIK